MNKGYGILKNKAIQLRKNGLSYGDIAKKLDISKSTASLWLHDIQLTPLQRKKLNANQAVHLNTGPHSSYERRKNQIQKIQDKAENEISFPLTKDAYKLFGAALYWAEGNKVNDFTITNSDPLLIQFMCQWFYKIFDIKPSHLKAHLNIYTNQNDIQIKKFWSDITKIPLSQFGKSFIKPVNKNYKKNTLYYGTIKVRVAKGTDLRYRVFGWINTVLKDAKIDVERIERKWYKLQDNYKR
jgi:transcriptional regulator with XRE-family HTH domain